MTLIACNYAAIETFLCLYVITHGMWGIFKKCLFTGTGGGAADVGLGCEDRPHRAFALEGCNIWHAATLSVAQQVAGPVRMRADLRMSLHVPGGYSPVSPGLNPTVNLGSPFQIPGVCLPDVASQLLQARSWVTSNLDTMVAKVVQACVFIVHRTSEQPVVNAEGYGSLGTALAKGKNRKVQCSAAAALSNSGTEP